MTATTSTTEPTTESPADERFVEHPLAPGRIAIHDPAIVEDNGTYYVFGTHRRCARSTDLVHWERFENNLTRDPASLLGGIWEAWPKQPENPALEGNTWAPDVIWNDVMRKWCMYLSVNGHEFRSVIVLLTADRLDGDWTYVGPVVYSGFNVDNVGRTDVPRVLGDEAAHGDLSRYASLKDTRINAIDAAPIRCDHGELWMSFGSWFGGIWMFKLDPKTGLRDYSVRYPLVHDSADPYYGVKVAGGYWNSGEGSYFVHRNGWWYLFMAYGWLGRTGGYQIRLFRSRNLVGPYVDQNGNPAISNGEIPDNQTKDTGIRLTSSVKWSGGPADDDTVEVSQGHNSVLTRGSDGRLFLTYHTRFIDRGDEDYETHVRELLPTADGWLTAAPYEYRGSAAVPPTAANTSDPTVGDDDDGLGDYIVASSSAPNLAARLMPLRPPRTRIGSRTPIAGVRRLRIRTSRSARVFQRHAQRGRHVAWRESARDDHAAAGRPRDQRRRGRLLRYAGREPAAVDRRPRVARIVADARRDAGRRALLRQRHGDHDRRHDVHRRVRRTTEGDRWPGDADVLRDRRQSSNLGRPYRGLKPLSLFPSL